MAGYLGVRLDTLTIADLQNLVARADKMGLRKDAPVRISGEELLVIVVPLRKTIVRPSKQRRKDQPMRYARRGKR